MILRAPRHTTQTPAERRGHFALCLVLICVTFVGCMGADEGIVPTFLPTATVEAAPALASIAGTWIGGYQLNNGSTEEGRVSLNFTESANGIEGRIELPLASVSEPLS